MSHPSLNDNEMHGDFFTYSSPSLEFPQLQHRGEHPPLMLDLRSTSRHWEIFVYGYQDDGQTGYEVTKNMYSRNYRNTAQFDMYKSL